MEAVLHWHLVQLIIPVGCLTIQFVFAQYISLPLRIHAHLLLYCAPPCLRAYKWIMWSLFDFLDLNVWKCGILCFFPSSSIVSLIWNSSCFILSSICIYWIKISRTLCKLLIDSFTLAPTWICDFSQFMSSKHRSCCMQYLYFTTFLRSTVIDKISFLSRNMLSLLLTISMSNKYSFSFGRNTPVR